MAAKKRKSYKRSGKVKGTSLRRAMYEDSGTPEFKPKGKGFTSNYRIVRNQEGGTDSIPYTPPNVYFNNENQYDTQIGNPDVEFGKGTGFNRTVQTMHGPVNLSADREYLPLQQETLKALAHKYRGKKLTEPYIIEGREGEEDQQGILTEREQAQLAKYMGLSTTAETIYQWFPNLREEKGASALPLKSRLMQRGAGTEGSEQAIHSGRYAMSGEVEEGDEEETDPTDIANITTGNYGLLNQTTPQQTSTATGGLTQGQQANQVLGAQNVSATQPLNFTQTGQQIDPRVTGAELASMNANETAARNAVGLTTWNPDAGGGVGAFETAPPVDDAGGGGASVYQLAGKAAEVIGGGIEQESDRTGIVRAGGGQGKRTTGQHAGRVLASTGKGAATGAAIGAALGAGVLSWATAPLGALVGGAIGLVGGARKTHKMNQESQKAYAKSAMAGARSSQTRRKKTAGQKAGEVLESRTVVNQEEPTNYNPFDPNKGGEEFIIEEENTPPMGSEGPQYKNYSGKIDLVKKYNTVLSKLEKNLRLNTGTGNTQQNRKLNASFGGGFDKTQGQYGGGAGLDLGIANRLRFGFDIGGSLGKGEEGQPKIYGGPKVKATYNLPGDRGNLGLSYSKRGPEVSAKINFEDSGKVSFSQGHYYNNSGKCLSCPHSYDESGEVAKFDKVQSLLNQVATGYYGPMTKKQEKNSWAEPIGPNTTIEKPGIYQMHGPTHEDSGDGTLDNPGGGSPLTVPVVDPETGEAKQENIIVDDLEYMETTPQVGGGMSTMTYNNNDLREDATDYEKIQILKAKNKKELELLVQMNPEFMEKLKKAGLA